MVLENVVYINAIDKDDDVIKNLLREYAMITE